MAKDRRDDPRTGAVRFVIDEVRRYSAMPAKEQFAAVREVGFVDYTLPSPSGRGDIICGPEACSHLHIIAREATKQGPFAGRVEFAPVLREISVWSQSAF